MDISIDRCAQAGRGVRSLRLALLALLCAFVLALAPTEAMAASAKEISKRAGLGVSAALITLVYSPAKLAYAMGGVVVGSLAYGFSGGDQEVAKVVFTPSVLGDYVVTPAQVTGEEPLEFFGRDPDYDLRKVNIAAAPVEPEFESDGW